jgi:hypothetical protein
VTTTDRAARTPRPRQTAPGADPVDVAIEQACGELRLPTIRDRFADIAEQALRDRSNYKGFLLDLLRAEMADRDERRKQRLVRDAAFYRPKRLEDSTTTRTPTSMRSTSTTWSTPAESAPALRWCSSATPAPAKVTCSSGSAPRSPNTAYACVTRPRRIWSTSSPRPTRRNDSPGPCTATPATTCSPLTSSLT